jgi:hypothetical protein
MTGGETRLAPARLVLAALALAVAFGVPLGAAAAPSEPGPRHGPVPDTVPSPEEVVRLLAPDGDRAEGWTSLARLAATLPPDRATLWVQLLALVERLGPEGGHIAARAVRLADQGDFAAGLSLLDRQRGAVPEAERPALIALAAHLADRVDPEAGAERRRRLVAGWPDALEAPEAQLLLARHLVRDAERRAEGIEILEDLLVRRPNHPLAPEARRLRLEATRR